MDKTRATMYHQSIKLVRYGVARWAMVGEYYVLDIDYATYRAPHLSALTAKYRTEVCPQLVSVFATARCVLCLLS
jgi:hypothetical protein